jgi:hypothetical protein
MDVEDHLARFRPVSPPQGLREQVLETCRRQQRSPWRPWPFVAAAVALFLLALANIAIEERLSATMLPAPMPPPPPDASPPVLEELGAGALSRLFVFPARASPASPQSFIRLRLEMGRSNS